MFPALSTARLGMKRLLLSGFHVDACRAEPIVPAVTGIWYQRTADCVDVLPRTVCAFQSDSTPSMFAYWFCIIVRGPSVSSEFPFFSTTVDGGLDQLEPAEESVGPVSVDAAGAAQSTWNFHTRTRLVQPQI